MRLPNLLVISPVFNESEVLIEFVEQIGQLRRQLTAECNLRLLLVDDGSLDTSFEKIKILAAKYEWLGYRRLFGNFGHQAALIAGLMSVDKWADAAVTIDSDLEHPPAVIKEMFQLWKQFNCSVVNGLRQANAQLPWSKQILSRLFYTVIAKLTGLKVAAGQTDFCLWDASVIRELLPHLQSIGSLRIFSSWLPGKKTAVTFQQNLRKNSKSHYTFGQNWNLTLNSIVRFSNKPLRLITVLGFLGLFVSALHVLQIIVALVHNEPIQPGWTTLIATIIFMGCLQLVCLGIISTYLRRLVFAKDLPLFLVKEEKLF